MAWLNEVCRLCLCQDKAMVPIFNEDYYKQLETSLHMKISSVADLLLAPGDGLPILACEECCQQVDVSYDFRLRCHQSDTQLRQFVDEPALEIMNAPDVKQEIEIVENGFDMGFPEEVDINEEEGSSNGSDTEELQNPDPLSVDPLSGSTIRLKSEYGLLAAQQSEDSLGESSMNPDSCTGDKGKNKRPRKQNLSKVNVEAPFLHDTDPSYMLALDESNTVPLVNSVDETSDNLKEPEFNCFICPARYLKKSYFLNHLKKHVKNSRQDTETDPEVSERLHVNINSLCDVDETELKKKEVVANFVCEICNSPYTLRRNYLKHLKFIHSIDKPPKQKKETADDEDVDEICDDVPHTELLESLKFLIDIDPQLDPQSCTCTICKTKPTFPTLTELIDHNFATHSSKEVSKCSFCKRKFFTLKSFMKHFKVHTLAKKFNCLECRATFVTEHHLKLHVTVTHNRGCPVCGKPLKRKADLSTHLKTHDPPRPEGAIVKKPRRKHIPEGIEPEIQQPGPSEIQLPQYEAPVDGEPVASTSSGKPRSRMSKIEGTLKTKNYFSQVYQTCLRKQHSLKKSAKHSSKKKKHKKMQGHKSTPPKEITKIVFGHKIKAHKEHSKKKRERKIGLIKMEKIPGRAKMIKTEKNKLPVTLKMGPSQVLKKSKFLTEVSVENVARGQENIRIAKITGKSDCLFCMKHFKGISKLKRHILIHTGERPFECEVCDRRFNQKPALKMHIIVCHTEKPFPCSQCSQKFSRQVMLLNHLEKHHNV